MPIKKQKIQKKRTKTPEKIPYEKIGKTRRLLPSFSPGEQKAYWYYRRNRKSDHEVGENRTLFSKTIQSIFDAVGELMIENEGGVFLEEYGYFTAAVLPWTGNGLESWGRIIDPLFHTDGYLHSLQFFPISRKSCMKGMHMAKSYNTTYRSKYYEAILNGFRPKLYYSTLKSIHDFKKHKYK